MVFKRASVYIFRYKKNVVILFATVIVYIVHFYSSLRINRQNVAVKTEMTKEDWMNLIEK